MTRKDFERLAQFVREQGSKFGHPLSHANFAGALAENLATDHPRFDKARFIRACMPTHLVDTRGEAAWDRRIEEATRTTK